MTQLIDLGKSLRVCLALLLLTKSTLGWTHDGHNEAPGESREASTSGIVTISQEARKNLGVKTFDAKVIILQETLTSLGQIEPIPGRSAAISSRISGRVNALFVNDGQTVKKGERLLEVESRQLGDPPPKVTYNAPFDGVIVDRHVVLGDTVEPDKHLMEVIDLSEVYAAGRIFEGQIAALTTGQHARVTIESFPRDSFEGTIELISGALNPSTRTLKTWVRLKNIPHKLRPNMRATLNIVVREVSSAIAIPHDAILGDFGDKFVFVQSDTNNLTFEKRSVVTGIRDDRYTEIIEGVLPGDKVVTVGGYQLLFIPAAPQKKS